MVRAEIRHRMTRRLANWDYAQRAIYMITITLDDRSQEWLGHLVNLAENGEARDGGVPAHSCAGSAVPGHSCAGSAAPGHSWPAFCPGWAEGFQDTILFRDGQLKAMIAYVRDNPRRLAEKRANPALFRRVARLERPLDGGRIIGAFEALGNRHLLDRPLHQVQCSRRFLAYRRVPKPGGGLKIARDAAGEPIVERETPDYRERLEAALAAAAHGTVTLSPCISDGERQIAREALKRRLPLVALKNMGFAKLEKPSGGYFEACAEGRLLLMAPAAWPHQTQTKDMTRFDATALNRIAQWLAGDGAIEINYHGMRPANIDELAEKAVEAQKGDAE